MSRPSEQAVLKSVDALESAFEIAKGRNAGEASDLIHRAISELIRLNQERRK